MTQIQPLVLHAVLVGTVELPVQRTTLKDFVEFPSLHQSSVGHIVELPQREKQCHCVGWHSFRIETVRADNQANLPIEEVGSCIEPFARKRATKAAKSSM